MRRTRIIYNRQPQGSVRFKSCLAQKFSPEAEGGKELIVVVVVLVRKVVLSRDLPFPYAL
jgi:hypothetical protein